MSSSCDAGATPRVLRGTAAPAVRPVLLGVELQRPEPIPAPDVVHRQIASAIDEGRRAGHDEGYRAGLQAGRAAAEQELAAALHTVAERAACVLEALERAAVEMRGHLDHVLGGVDELVVTGAFELAQAVIGRELEVAVDPGRDALVRAMTACGTQGSVTVRLNPRDLETLGDINDLVHGRDVRLVADGVVEPGGAIVDGESWSVDARLSSAVERARKVLFS